MIFEGWQIIIMKKNKINLNKRKFIKTFSIGCLSLPFLKGVKANYKPKIVVVGGGFGGGSCLAYLQKFSTQFDIFLIEKNKNYYTCPYSNSVVGGFRSFKDNKFRLNSFKYNDVKLIYNEVKFIDSEKRSIKFSNNESLNYDWLIISPGIDFKWGDIEGYDFEISKNLPHGWNGADAEKILNSINSLEDNSTILLSVPDYPYRCPPAPYERASLIAYNLKKRGMRFKIIILDSKDSFTKKDLFIKAWNELYPKSIEWIPRSKGGKVIKLDYKNKLLTTETGQRFKGQFINIIPNQKSKNLFLNDNKKDWFKVNPTTFELLDHKYVHAVGDCIDAGDMPKSAFSANSQAKVCAENLKNIILNKEILDPVFFNTCYSFASSDYVFSISSWYKVNKFNDKIVSLGTSESNINDTKFQRNVEVGHSKGWYQTITKEVFG